MRKNLGRCLTLHFGAGLRLRADVAGEQGPVEASHVDLISYSSNEDGGTGYDLRGQTKGRESSLIAQGNELTAT